MRVKHDKHQKKAVQRGENKSRRNPWPLVYVSTSLLRLRQVPCKSLLQNTCYREIRLAIRIKEKHTSRHEVLEHMSSSHHTCRLPPAASAAARRACPPALLRGP